MTGKKADNKMTETNLNKNKNIQIKKRIHSSI